MLITSQKELLYLQSEYLMLSMRLSRGSFRARLQNAFHFFSPFLLLILLIAIYEYSLHPRFKLKGHQNVGTPLFVVAVIKLQMN